MAITNPTKYVTVRRLERFKQKVAALIPSITVASTQTCEDIIDELT